MQKAQQEGKRKFKLIHPKSKSQKAYPTITRCQNKEVPKVKRKSVSLYKIDYTKEYALPLDSKDQLKFQFWGCAHPPKKIKVRNPFQSQNKPKDRLLTGQSTNLLKTYLFRKIGQAHKTIVINPSRNSSHEKSGTQTPKKQSESIKDLLVRNARTLSVLSPGKGETYDTRFFMSTMITDCEDSIAQTPSQKFRPLKETIFMEKMHEMKEKINQKNKLLGQIKSNMNMIRFKKMNLLDFQ